ncbi:alpha/beta hydrolase [Fuscibacter oryzae]|uniref:alpha/beta hydrolase n=1 Tax=Fuscibacter oryzae TaxID=2803939 RepID=UPI002E2C1887|nr:alpha/beta fold hydrolase [Fuscibacter oryzae]
MAWVFAKDGPVERNLSFDEAILPESSTDLAAWLARSELQFSDIRPGDGKQIVWAGVAGKKTPLAIVYLHGFSGGPWEIRPVPDRVAKALGANLFFTRLTGHGRSSAAMAMASAGDWLHDTAEALAIGRRLGDRVVVIATSTGGTLAAVAATEPALAQDMAGIVMISPNFGLRRGEAMLLDMPFVQAWGPLLVGRELGFEPVNAGHAAHWTTRYPTRAVFPMAALVNYARKLDYGAVKVPILVLISPQDQVVSPRKTRSTLAGWGGPVTLVERQIGPGDDPYAHILAGDILSPNQTAPVVGLITDWLRGLQ